MSRLPEKSTDLQLWRILQGVDEASGNKQSKVLEFIDIVPGDFVIVWRNFEAKKSESRDWFMAEVVIASALIKRDDQKFSNLKVIDIETGLIQWTNNKLVQKVWINQMTPATMWCAN